MTVALAAMLTACAEPALAQETGRQAPTSPAPTTEPVTDRYIWCLVDAGSLGVPDPISVCADIR